MNIDYMGDADRTGRRITFVVHNSGFGFIIRVYTGIGLEY